MQVIRDLRAGVRLRKVSADDGSNSRIPGVYEMTPYEMLMEDIRLRRFSLKASNLVNFGHLVKEID
jgi:spire